MCGCWARRCVLIICIISLVCSPVPVDSQPVFENMMPPRSDGSDFLRESCSDQSCENVINEMQPSKTKLSQMNKEMTIVTGLFDIGRGNWSAFRREYNDYLTYMEPLLNLDINLVIFVEQKGANFVRKVRHHFENRTRVRVLKVSDLLFYRYLDDIDRIQKSQDFIENHDVVDHPEAFSPLYNIVTNSKPYLVHLAIQENYFNSSYFFWLDAGYGHKQAKFPSAGQAWAPNNLRYVTNRVTYIKLVDFDLDQVGLADVYRRNVEAFINGCFFGGRKNPVEEYFRVHKEVFEIYLRNGITDDDQTLALGAYWHKPELFYLVSGEWYSVFDLFF